MNSTPTNTMSQISLFEVKQVRRAWNAEEQKWLFALVDIIAVPTDSPNPQVYWRVLKKRLRDEGNETVTDCNALKMTAAEGKQRMTDVAQTEALLRIIQSIPSPKAEPFKLWLAKVGYERLEEIETLNSPPKRLSANLKISPCKDVQRNFNHNRAQRDGRTVQTLPESDEQDVSGSKNDGMP